MDCAGLRADIDELRQRCRALEETIEETRESKDGGAKGLQDVMRRIDPGLSDAILEKYLEDFREQDSDVLPAIELGKRIEIKDREGGDASIESMAVTKDGYVMIGGDRGVCYIGSYNKQGELALSERIDIRNIKGKPASITSIVTTEDGRILIGGLRSTLYAGAFDISFETLKQHLPEIIKKGDV